MLRDIPADTARHRRLLIPPNLWRIGINLYPPRFSQSVMFAGENILRSDYGSIPIHEIRIRSVANLFSQMRIARLH